MQPELNNWLAQQQRMLEPKIPGNLIPRTIEEFDPSGEGLFQHFDVKTLQKEVFEHKNIVLLGGAGSGKSFELLKLAIDHSLPGRVPVYVKLNQYEDGPFEPNLPDGWRMAAPKDCLLLLDGLDEIKQDFRTTAIERIYEFSQAYPDTRIVISCRANFFNEDEVSAKKQLPGFNIYEINDLIIQDVVDYSSIVLQQNGKEFVEQARRIGFNDLLLKPFFLDLLIGYFKQNGSLAQNRKEILESFVKSNIKNDIIRYELDDVKGTVQEEVYILLQRCALVMESIGRNFLQQDEIEGVLNTPLNLRLMRHFALLAKNSDQNGTWSFQHNIIQEYLAAKAISGCDTNEIKSFLSTSPRQHHIKSYWLNTFSILMSLVPDTTKDDLWDWVLSVNPEMLVKIEPDRIDEDRRVMILQYILEDFKLKDLFLHSYYFTEKELSNFSEGPLAFEYLLMEIANKNIDETARMNALKVLRYFTRLSITQRQRLKETMLTLLDQFSNVYTIDFIIASLIDLEFTTPEVLQNLMDTFKDRRNQYIRTAIYRMIEVTDQADDQVHYIIEGMKIISLGTHEDRSATNLISEQIVLQRLVLMLESGQAIRTIIEYFTASYASLRFFDDVKQVFLHLTGRAASLYNYDPTFFSVMANFARALASRPFQDDLHVILNFFQLTATTGKFFETVWNDRTLNAYIRMTLISELADDDTFADFHTKFKGNLITINDVAELLELISRNVYDDKMQRKKLTAQRLYESLAGLSLNVHSKPADDYPILKERNQRDFGLLFDGEHFREALQRLFEKLNVTYVSLYDLRRLFDIEKPWDASATPRPVQHFIREFGSHRCLSWKDITALLQSEQDFHRFLMKEMHALLSGNTAIEVAPAQRDFIEQWCRRELNKFSINRARLYYDNNAIGDSCNGINQLIYSFYFHFGFELPPDKMLTFTLPVDFREHDVLGVLTILEKQLGKEPVLRQVRENIRYQISYDNINIANYAYVLKHKLRAVEEYLKRDLVDATRNIKVRIDLYSLYINTTSDYSLALDLMQALPLTDPLYNALIDDASKADKQLVIQLLNKRLLDPNLPPDDKTATAVAWQNWTRLAALIS